MKIDHDGLEAASVAFWAKYHERSRKSVDAPDYEPMQAALHAYVKEAGGIYADIMSAQAWAIVGIIIFGVLWFIFH